MRHLRNLTLAAMAAAVCLTPVGCGSGADPATQLTGVVTDVEGKPVAGAAVSCSGRSVTSLTNGTFTMSGVPSGYRTVSASLTIEGRRWSGETKVDIASGLRNCSVNVIVSDDRYHARLMGAVIDPAGFGLSGAKVFVGGPWGSTLAITAADGSYDIRRITPGVTYTVTCSLAGYVNDTRTVHLSANEIGNVSFALAYGSSQGTIPAPSNPAGQAWTIADRISRGAAQPQGYMAFLKAVYRARRGLPPAPRSATAARATPAGSLIEVDLFWDFSNWNDLLGYAIKRGLSSPPSAVTAVLRDPLAASYFDVDAALTPNTTYYYTIHCLDTIDFPADGTVGPAGDVVEVRPLQPVEASAPAQGASVSGDPEFRWTPVSGATAYQVIVWNRFPDLQNSADPSGATPIWPADMNNPGASKVQAPQTSVTYSGPYLQAGTTYYWLVVASDLGEYSLSVTPLRRFVAR